MTPDRGAPRILITAKADAVPQRYADAVRLAGGEPVVVRPGDPSPGACDGLLLSGGGDIHPRHYGQAIIAAVAATLAVDEARDQMELELARGALAAGLPVLGICRGAQVLNVAVGGTLWQDLSLVGLPRSAHYQNGTGQEWDTSHDVLVEPGSLLEGIVGPGPIAVNSYHHQAVADPAPGFAVTSRARDGTIEGLEGRAHRFALAVQWHPERLVRHHPVHLRLFTRLVEEARRP